MTSRYAVRRDDLIKRAVGHVAPGSTFFTHSLRAASSGRTPAAGPRPWGRAAAGTMQRLRLPSHPHQCGLDSVADVCHRLAAALWRPRHPQRANARDRGDVKAGAAAPASAVRAVRRVVALMRAPPSRCRRGRSCRAAKGANAELINLATESGFNVERRVGLKTAMSGRRLGMGTSSRPLEDHEPKRQHDRELSP
jgi:hypothetical protein